MNECENVIKGLECCMALNGPECGLCPYESKYIRCKALLRDDIIDLLKSRKPRLMTLEEVIKSEGAFWLEFCEEDNDDYIRYGYAFFSSSTPYAIEIIAQDSFRPLYAFITNEYGVRWRCWTTRPTNEQSKSTPWEK